jgi:hypothetical protein
MPYEPLIVDPHKAQIMEGDDDVGLVRGLFITQRLQVQILSRCPRYQKKRSGENLPGAFLSGSHCGGQAAPADDVGRHC